MTFKIDKPGLYRTRDGFKAEALKRYARDSFPWKGARQAQNGAWIVESWTDDGMAMWPRVSESDIVGPWGEPVPPKPRLLAWRWVNQETYVGIGPMRYGEIRLFPEGPTAGAPGFERVPHLDEPKGET